MCLLVACYEPEAVDCAYLCALDGDACPEGTSCEGGFCRTPGAMGDCPGDLCGNRRIDTDAGEECDDNNDDTDDCAQCKRAICGDGFVRAGFEQCDDKNSERSDGCVSCAWAYCGDGEKRAGVEECETTEPGCTRDCLPCAGPSATTWPSDDGHCYGLVTTTAPFSTAQTACTNLAGHLYTAASESQRAEIGARLIDNTGAHAWIGLYQPTPNGTVSWVTGETVGTWMNLNNEDGGAPEDCFTQAPGTREWGDWGCSTAFAYVCEIEPWTIEKPIVDNHAYRVFYTLLDWNTAAAICMQIVPGKSHLATLDDERERSIADALAHLDVWVGGPTCNVLRGDSIFDEMCGLPHYFMCEID